MSERLWPQGRSNELANEFVTELERTQLEYLMGEMYYWREKAEKCGCAQCTQKGDITHRAYWEEHQRVRSAPAMDHEDQMTYDYALDKLDQIIKRNKEIERRNKKK